MAGREQNILLRANVQRKKRSEVRGQIAEVKSILRPAQDFGAWLRRHGFNLCNLTSSICNTIPHAFRSDWTCGGRCCRRGWLPVHGSDWTMVWADVGRGGAWQQAACADLR